MIESVGERQLPGADVLYVSTDCFHIRPAPAADLPFWQPLLALPPFLSFGYADRANVAASVLIILNADRPVALLT